MSKIKLLEVRDRATFIPVFAFAALPENDEQAYLLGRSGFGRDRLIMVGLLNGGRGRVSYDPYDWTGARTMKVAHQYIADHWDSLVDGDVVCVEHILGERDAPKTSERLLP